MKIEHGTWVVVADGGKFLLLRNRGDAEFPNLEVIGKEELANPPARELASDRPGRQADTGPGARSAMQQTDWHELEERRFAADLAARLEDWAGQGRFPRILVVAEARALGQLRPAYGQELKSRLVGEVGKDLTNLPVYRIEEVLSGL